MLRDRPYSRIPVFEGDLDHIRGIVQSRDILQVPDSEAHTRTVRDLMNSELYFVPETKRGSELLRELQRENIQLAIVIDEYGGVAGVVTIEDLVEEIVGEIHDERQDSAEVVKEKDGSYIVPGSMDIDHLDELFGMQAEALNLDEWEATTVAGFVTEVAGHIPKRGEFVEHDGLIFEILDATSRRVERLRIRVKLEANSQNSAESVPQRTKQDNNR